MIRLKNKDNDASSNDLIVHLKDALKLPLYYMEDSLITDITLEEESDIDNDFTNELYDPDVDSRFTPLINFKPLLYFYKLRLIHDDLNKNLFLVFDLDYVPLQNTVNRSISMLRINLAGKKENPNPNMDDKIYTTLTHELIGGNDNDVAIPQPSTSGVNGVSSSDFKLYRVNMTGILSKFKSKIRIKDSNDVYSYAETNELYLLRIDKKKVFGDDTNLHLHQVLPRTLNKFSVEYIGRLSDVKYVYLPIQL